MSAYKNYESYLIRLKHPLGKLLTGSSESIMDLLKDFIKVKNPSKIFAVGDVTASNMIKSGINVDVIIIDFRSKRQPIEKRAIQINGFMEIRIDNPRGSITDVAYKTVDKAVQSISKTAIIVNGEEDLLVLPTIKFAPLGSLLVYGQPNVGVVLVHVTEKVKEEIEPLLNLAIKKNTSKRLSIRFG